MDILKSTRLSWTINDDSLDEEDVTLDDDPLTQADLNLLGQPIQLKTQNLVLHLQPMKYAHREDRVGFPTGPVVTPLQILGAIHTYYSLPLTKAELDRLVTEGDEMVKDIIDEARVMIDQGLTVPRVEIMGGDIFFEGLKEERDGSFTLNLGS